MPTAVRAGFALLSRSHDVTRDWPGPFGAASPRGGFARRAPSRGTRPLHAWFESQRERLERLRWIRRCGGGPDGPRGRPATSRTRASTPSERTMSCRIARDQFPARTDMSSKTVPVPGSMRPQTGARSPTSFVHGGTLPWIEALGAAPRRRSLPCVPHRAGETARDRGTESGSPRAACRRAVRPCLRARIRHDSPVTSRPVPWLDRARTRPLHRSRDTPGARHEPRFVPACGHSCPSQSRTAAWRPASSREVTRSFDGRTGRTGASLQLDASSEESAVRLAIV